MEQHEGSKKIRNQVRRGSGHLPDRHMKQIIAMSKGKVFRLKCVTDDMLLLFKELPFQWLGFYEFDKERPL